MIPGYMFWRRLGDLISICITQGLHMEIEVGPRVAFWQSETRKSTWSHAYILDKGISSFMVQGPGCEQLQIHTYACSRVYCSLTGIF